MKCFTHHKTINKCCEKKYCRYWINYSQSNNCCLIASQESETLTLKEIGKIIGVTRMRICQIEKNAVKKLQEKISGFLTK